MFGYVSLDPAEVLPPEPARGRQRYRFEPELGDYTSLLDVDVRRLRPLVALEEEPGSADPTNDRHHGSEYLGAPWIASASIPDARQR